MLLLRTRHLVIDAQRVEQDGALLVGDDGRIAACEAGGAAQRLAASAPRGARRVDVDDVLGPGLVNAHAHLDLSALLGQVPATGGFVPWIGALLRERSRATRDGLVAAARAAARSMLEAGTTAVGDIDTLGVAAEALAGVPLRALLLREALDGDDASRAGGVLDETRDALLAPTGSERVARGLSPHAPHTVSPELSSGLRGLRDAVGRLPRAQIHWAETEDEVTYLAEGSGPFASILGGPREGAGETGLERLAAAGWLSSESSLVHGNHPEPGDPERLAAAGTPLVHCPGTHAFFAREPFPWERYRDAGVTLALGTDSLASNDRLDLRLEMARLRAACPGLFPSEVLAAATTGAARALGLEAGRLVVGSPADLVVHAAPAGIEPESVLDHWTSDEPRVLRVWCAGELAVEAISD